ncbi:MAG TPA: peptide ABC transporter substrate-binding protein [Candidatus Saccharimonadales bacterium]|nr:peptide ABC transporter substrate-binding protein [Candidatus Saccharimonadales bacterium]
MQLKLFKLRFRRRLKKQRKQVEGLSSQAERQIEHHLIQRAGRFRAVRRFVVSWMLLFVLLIGCGVWQTARLSIYYQTLRPVPGGIYSEGLRGSFTTANPIYATNDVDTMVARLIFAGLLKYDDNHKLVNDLASDYSVDEKGTTYTMHLKPDLTWQDGHALTSSDVVFTFQAIQNPDSRSPLASGWQGINITAPDARTIIFTLPSPLASFPHNLTTGIVPEHLLSNIAMADLRSADFNTSQPIGAGPFKWQAVQVSGTGPANAQEQIALIPFKYYAGGAPKLKEFIVHAFASQNELIQAFKSKQLTTVSGLQEVPADLLNDKSVQVHSPLLMAATMVFFKTSNPILSDGKVRQALVQAAQPNEIIKTIGFKTRPVKEPLLLGQLGYNPAYSQPSPNLAAAKSLLDQAGWLVGAAGLRSKNGQVLKFTLTATDTSEYRMVTNILAQNWQAVGAKVDIHLQDSQVFTSTLSNHDYDAVLYGISIGADPDVFVYWDSSQANVLSPNRLNLSEYKSAKADASLEAGRTRLDPSLRAIKYQPFLQAWQADLPALGLYQPRLLYLTNGPVYGFNDHSLISPTDRFNNVENWMIRTAKVTN